MTTPSQYGGQIWARPAGNADGDEAWAHPETWETPR
jgi:hypothetical protein